ncbi:MAG: amidohydrolase family protein [Alphaproteobacteria bacterium]
MADVQQVATVHAGHLLARPGEAAAGGPCRIDIVDGRIAAVAAAAPSSLPSGAGRLAALPAPTDAHDHGRGMRCLAFGAKDDALEVWLNALGREPRVDPYLRAIVAFGRMAEGGVCAANHCHNTQDPEGLVREAEAVSRAARDVGVRVAFASPISDRNSVVYGDPAPLFAKLPAAERAVMEKRASRWQPIEDQLAAVDAIAAFEHPLFRVQYCPIGPQWVSDATLEKIADASARTGRRVHMHLFETRHQREWADANYPGGLIRRLDAIGLLSPRLTVAHGVWLDEAECALLAERGVTVSVNTSSNLRLRSGPAPVARFLNAGLPFGIGLDGMAFDDDEDMLREIRLVWQHHRGLGVDDRLSPARLFRAACVDGRRTVVDDGGGALEPGAAADMMLLDLDAMGDDLLPDAAAPLDLLLTRMTKRHLDKLVVAGRLVVDGGRCVSVDLPALIAALTEQARAAWAATPDAEAMRRIEAAVADYYRCGCHREPFPAGT